MSGGAPLACPVHSMLAASDVGRVVEALYPVGRIVDGWLLRRGFNDVYVCVAEDGTHHLVRLGNRGARGPSNVAFETSLLAHLRATGVPVAAPRATHDGALSTSLAAPEGPRDLVLFEHIVGEEQNDTAEDLATTGAGLAAIHTHAARYDGPPSRYELGLPHLLERPLARLCESRALRSDPGLVAELRRVATLFGDRIAGMHDELTWLPACHGDCHGGNNLMVDAPQRNAWFFDFDDAGPGYLAYDLAVLLWSRSYGKPAPDETALTKWRAFIDGDRRVRDIPCADLRAVAAFVPIRHFWYMGEVASRADQWGSASLPHAWLARQVGVLEGWAEVQLTESTPGP